MSEVLPVSTSTVLIGTPGIDFIPGALIVTAAVFAIGTPDISTGGSLNVGQGLEALKDLRLNRLSASVPIVDQRGNPSLQMQRDYQQNVEQTEGAIRAISAYALDTRAIVQVLLSAQQAIDNATAAAKAANDEIAASKAYIRVRDSYPDGAPTAENVGGNVTINIPAHTRHYIDPEQHVPVDGGTLNSQPVGVALFVYYDDPDLSGGPVTYYATEDEAASIATASRPYRHQVGRIDSPSEPGSGGVGNPTIPPWKFQEFEVPIL